MTPQSAFAVGLTLGFALCYLVMRWRYDRNISQMTLDALIEVRDDMNAELAKRGYR